MTLHSTYFPWAELDYVCQNNFERYQMRLHSKPLGMQGGFAGVAFISHPLQVTPGTLGVVVVITGSTRLCQSRVRAWKSRRLAQLHC